MFFECSAQDSHSKLSVTNHKMKIFEKAQNRPKTWKAVDDDDGLPSYDSNHLLSSATKWLQTNVVNTTDF
jgi:hypothetical protein